MEIISCIYQIISKIRPRRKYVGSAVNYERRVKKHISELKTNKHHSRYLQNHVNKYGVTDIYFKIIEVVTNNSIILEREQFYINKLNPCFNVCKIAGNQLGIKRTSETIKRMRDAKLNMTAETKQKISDAKKGVKQSIEHTEKMRLTKIGLTFTLAHRKKISESLMGKKRKPFTDNHRKNISISVKKRPHKKWEFNGLSMTIPEWSNLLNISEITLRGRLNNLNWSAEKAFTTPIITKFINKKYIK